MTLAARLGPAAVATGFAAMFLALQRPPEEAGVVALVVAAALAAVVWALVDLERFVLVGVLAAMTFPQELLHAGGALVAAADLLLLVAVAAWGIRASLDAAPPMFLARNPLLVPGLLFVAVNAASVAWTTSLPLTVKTTVQMLEIVVVLTVLFASIPMSLARIRQGLTAYVVLTTALAAITTLLFAPRALRGDVSAQYLPGLHKTAIGSFLGVGLILAFSLALDRSRAPATRRWFAAAAAVELCGLVASVSRGALLGVVVALPVASLLLRRKRALTFAFTAAATVLLLALTAAVGRNSAEYGGFDTNELRLFSYLNAVERIRADPYLGSGAGTYWDEIPELEIGLADPNNIFLLTWAELGLLGMAAILFLLWRFVRVLVQARRLPEHARHLAVGCGAAALTLFVHFQVDATWTRGTTSIAFALIGLMLASSRLVAAERVPAPATRAAAVTAPPAPPLRALHVVSSDAFAGIERHVLRLARGLRERGVDCTIACPPGATRLRLEAVRAGVPVLPPDSSRRSGWFSDVVARLRQAPPDVVHVHDGGAAVAGWRLAALGRSKLVRTQHFVRPASVERTGWRRAASLALHRALNSDVHALVAVSESVAAAAAERHEAAREKVSVIGPGIDLPTDEQLAAADAARAKLRRPVVAYLGRLEQEKGVQLLLCAIPLVLQRVPDCRFVIAGAGSQHAELRTLARKLRIGRSITWLGEVADPATVFSRAHVLVSPSTVEAFGLAAAEAMSYGVPVVAMRAGGSAETVEHGVTGLLVDDVEPVALAEAIAALAGDLEHAAKLGLHARARARDRFGVDLTAASTLDLYRRLRAEA